MLLPLAIGIAIAVVIAAIGRITRFDQDRSFYAVTLIVIASYYILFAVMAQQAIVEETLVATAFAATALLGALRWPLLLGVGIAAHGVFDFIHPALIDNAGVPIWWPPFCAGVDIVLGAWVIYAKRFIQN